MTWKYYTTARGKDVVREERDDLLDEFDVSRLDALLDEVDAGRAVYGGDYKRLRGKYRDMWEVKFDAGDCTYRLVYAHVRDGERVLLALSLAKKRGDAEQSRQLRTAKKRLQDWTSRHR
jgi:phage-related protein